MRARSPIWTTRAFAPSRSSYTISAPRWSAIFSTSIAPSVVWAPSDAFASSARARIEAEAVDVDEAVRRAQVSGLAVISVSPDGAASLYAALINGLQLAGVPTHTRTTAAPTRNSGADTFSAFTLVVYPEGVGGSEKRMSWFRTDAPMTWKAARDQLAAAKVIDRNAIGPKQAGYWRLVTDPRVFMPMRAKPLPIPASTRPRDAARTSRYALEGGRVIVRDGQPVVRLERVDLGDERYALSPHETDELAARIVRLLNRRGAR